MKEPAGTITISGHASQSRKTWPGVRTTCLRSAPARSRASRSSCLRTLTAPHGGGRAGLETLAAAIGEPADTLQDTVEPYLIQQGLIERTAQGRTANVAAWERFPDPASMRPTDQPTLTGLDPDD